MKHTHLTVTSRGIYAYVGNKRIRKINTLADLDGLPEPIMCSSSLDFPEEYTKNKKIIKLARDIRNPSK